MVRLDNLTRLEIRRRRQNELLFCMPAPYSLIIFDFVFPSPQDGSSQPVLQLPRRPRSSIDAPVRSCEFNIQGEIHTSSYLLGHGFLTRIQHLRTIPGPVRSRR